MVVEDGNQPLKVNHVREMGHKTCTRLLRGSVNIATCGKDPKQYQTRCDPKLLVHATYIYGSKLMYVHVHQSTPMNNCFKDSHLQFSRMVFAGHCQMEPMTSVHLLPC